MSDITARLIGDNPASIPPGVLVSFDCETTGLDWSDFIIGASLSWRDLENHLQSCYLVFEAIQPVVQMSIFGIGLETINSLHLLEGLFKNNHLVFHSISFDYRFLFKDLGLAPPTYAFDISPLAKNLEYQPALSLVELYRRYVKRPIPEHILKTKSNRGGLHKQDIETQAIYARWDAEATLLVGEKLLGMSQLMLETELVRHDAQFTNLVLKMIARGLPVDCAELTRRHILYEERLAYLVKELAETYKLSNVGSTAQVSDFLFSKQGLNPTRLTASGKGAVGAEDLEPYVKKHPAVPLIIEHRQLTKVIGTWLKPLEILSAGDNRAHCQLNPFGTLSFRMSCKNINLQAMPMKERGERAFDSLHGIFKSENPDEQLWSLDLKQAEVRLGAMLAPDPALARVFSSGSDPYKAMSKEIWGTEDRRQEAKQATLAAIYEIGPASFSIRYKVSEDYAIKVLDDFRARFPGIKRASNWWKENVEQKGFVKLYTGRYRWFGEDEVPWKGFNQVLQGGVAEIMSAIMLEVEKVLPDRQLLQIHDNIILYLPKDEQARSEMVKTVEDIALNILPVDVMDHVKPRVPLLLDAEIWE